MSRRRRHVRRPDPDLADSVIDIRIGSKRAPRNYRQIQVTSPRDAPRLARLVDDEVRSGPQCPLIISVNGHQPWLQEVLSSCIEDYWDDISGLNRELQFAGTAQFPERASKRAKRVPWTFIVDEMNVPQVYWWSVGARPQVERQNGLPNIDMFRMRVGVWTCGRGACRFDPNISVTLIFTQPTEVANHVVGELMFPYLYHADNDHDQPREDDEGICWIFTTLFMLLTDWQNILREVVLRLEDAEFNSGGRSGPVKLRTRTLHREINRLYELKEYLHFHQRAFKKLQKLKDDVPKQEQQDPLWSDMDDAVDDLEQADSSLDLLRERFNNLIELEFNIENASQSDNSRFLSIIATLFLPVSYLASIFGITTITWRSIWYLYVAIPVVILSIIFTIAFPLALAYIQKIMYPINQENEKLTPRNFTMLGDALPDSVNVPGGQRNGRSKKAQRPLGNADDTIGNVARSRSRAESRTGSRSRGPYEKTDR